MTTVYVLRLMGGRYYVGKTNNIAERLKQHQQGLGSGWTKLYSFVAVEKVYQKVSPFAEDMLTKELMSKHGIDNVRGGVYVTTVLSAMQRAGIEQEIRGALNQCLRCGAVGHFVSNCSKVMAKRARSEANADADLEHLKKKIV